MYVKPFAALPADRSLQPRLAKSATLLQMCVLTILLTLSEVSHATASTPASCGLYRLASIDLIISAADGVLIPVRVNQHDGFMAFDVGSISAVTERAVHKLGLHTQRFDGAFPIESPDGSAISRTAVIDLKLGQLEAKNIKIPVEPTSAEPNNVSANAVDIDPDRYFGQLSSLDFKGNIDVEIDLAHHKLNLYSSVHCPGRVVYWANRYAEIPFSVNPMAIYFPMTLNGKAIATTLSLSIARTELSDGAAQALYGIRADPKLDTVTLPAGAKMPVIPAMTLRSDGMDVLNARVALFHDRRSCIVQSDGRMSRYGNCAGAPLVLGIDVLKQLRIYIASKERVIYFTAADAAGNMPSSPHHDLTPASSTESLVPSMPAHPAKAIYAPSVPDYYPASALAHHEQGYAVVHICISQQGRVVSSAVNQSTGYLLLDKAAERLAKDYKFVPATDAEGRPIPMCTDLPVTFRIFN